jgi:hypothetical protein
MEKQMKFDSIKRTLNGLLAALAIFMASPSVAMAFVADTASLNGSLTGLWNNADQPGWGTRHHPPIWNDFCHLLYVR